jgi:hypothetical protein
MAKRFIVALLVSLLLVAGGRVALADEAPAGPVLLTVAGAIGKANRGPVDPFLDAYLAYHEIAFDSAYAFDRAALEAFGMHRITTKYPGTDRVIDAEGPLLRDVLAAAGVTAGKAFVTALDGYAAEIAVADALHYDIVLALRADDRALSVGGRGPAWVVFPDDPVFAERGDAAWVWAAFFIRVE